MKKIVFSIIAFTLSGCATIEDLDNVIRVRAVNTSFILDYVYPQVQGVSIQTKGKIDYPFNLKFQNEHETIEVSNP